MDPNLAQDPWVFLENQAHGSVMDNGSPGTLLTSR